ncbi:uracil-DNA glycosylase [Myxosarcina sp. GI1]|uniref:uracil-DNA glycosylase n=1 Tax=Myxosarcina sp. GI1 TaxID=1541065 RepID=UPI0005691219|nr:uracil-DNA glycosylase [Myxosarcina sp. GI1]
MVNFLMAKKLKSLLDNSFIPIEFNSNLVCGSWQELEANTNNCQACELYKGRTQVVAGRYSKTKNADLLIIGEAPGQVEDEKGLAFVGDSGKLLDIMLDAVGLENYYVTNAVRCRPPDNRNPVKSECQSCWRFLQSEIALVKPKAILCLGKVAAKTVFGGTGKFEKLMRSRHQFFEYPVWVAYHPAYLLRQPQLSSHSPKWETWQVLCRLKLYLNGLRLESSDE